MKKTLTLTLLCLLMTAIYLVAAEKEQEEEYDEDLYGPEALVIWEKPVEGVVFSHKRHTYQAGLDCGDCHDDLFEMMAGAAEEAEDFTMEAIYDGEYCGACHDGGYAFAADTRCTACHIGVRGINRLQDSSKEEEESH